MKAYKFETIKKNDKMPVDFTKIPSPCFVIEERLLRQNLEILDRVQKETGAKIIVALKGYAMWSTFPMIAEYLPGGAASSSHEARLIAEEMQKKAYTYCPVYFDEEFDKILGYSSHVTFNSLGQWQKFKEKALRRKDTVSFGLRINPEYSEVETDLYNPARPGSRLGITSDQLGIGLPEGIEGLHFHALCENDSYVLERTLVEVEKRFSHLIHQCKWFNMGGGHHITRKDYDVDHLITILNNFQKKYPNIKELILEPGEAIGWQTGYLVSTVRDIVENHGKKIAMLDVSFTAHMPDCLEMPYKPEIHGAMDEVPGKPTYSMGGLTCLAGDVMDGYSFDKSLQVGDIIVFDDMIHYTMVKTNTFNGVNLPSIGIWKEDDSFTLLRSFGYEDYKFRLS